MKPVVALATGAFLALSAPAWGQQELRPTGQYPSAALEQGLGGTVGLECVVADEASVDCDVTSEMQLLRVVQFLPGPPPSVRNVSGGAAPLQWEQRPNAYDFARHFPEQALMRGISGSVLLDCVVNVERRLECEIASETPRGHGFGRAALRIAERFRAPAQTVNGENTVGGRIRVPIRMNVGT